MLLRRTFSRVQTARSAWYVRAGYSLPRLLPICSLQDEQGLLGVPLSLCGGGKGQAMSSQVVTYRVDDSTTVKLEIEPTEGFRPAGPGEVVGRIRDAIAPAVEAAKVVLEKVKEIGPDEIEVKFGVKASGEASWLVAKAAGEGNFEVTLTWSRDEGGGSRRGENTGTAMP